MATTPSRLSSTPITPPPPISVVPGTRYAFPAHYDKDDPIQERPADLRLNVRFYQLNNLTWMAWGTDGADGSGTEFTQTDCDPSCVEGTHYRVPVRIHAFNPKPLQPDSGCPANVAGVLFYSEVILTYLPTTAVSAPKDQESGEGFRADHCRWAASGSLLEPGTALRSALCESHRYGKAVTVGHPRDIGRLDPKAPT